MIDFILKKNNENYEQLKPAYEEIKEILKDTPFDCSFDIVRSKVTFDIFYSDYQYYVNVRKGNVNISIITVFISSSSDFRDFKEVLQKSVESKTLESLSDDLSVNDKLQCKVLTV